MKSLTEAEIMAVSGGRRNNVELCIGATTLIFAGAGTVVGSTAGLGFGGALGFTGGGLGQAVGQMFCSSYFSN